MAYLNKLIAPTALFWAATTVLSSSAHADVTTRYGELQAVVDTINDPDPLMRLAQLEDILKKGDATEVQLAIRTAFQVNDPNVRSLALRAHFASFKTFIIRADLPENIKAILEGKDQEAAKDLSSNNLVSMLRRQGFQFSMISDYPSSEALEFGVRSRNEGPSENDQKRYMGTGNIRGGLIDIAGNISNNGNQVHCSFEFTDYDGFTLVGMGACGFNNGFAFPIKLNLFDNDKPAGG